MGGSRGGGVTKTSTIPDEWKPYITRSLARAEGADLGHVEGLTTAQKDALAAQENIARTAAGLEGGPSIGQQFTTAAEGIRDTSALKDASAAAAQEALAGQRSQAALGGRLGSARQQALEAEQENRLARQFADLDYQANKDYLGTIGKGAQLDLAAAEQLGQAGQTRQAQLQAEKDAEYQALNRLFGLYGSAPFQSQQNIQKGGK